MPALEIKTNVKLENPKEFLAEFSQFAATLLNYPPAYVCVIYTYNEFLAWEGTLEPAFLLTVGSAGSFKTPEAIEEYSKTLFAYMEKNLGVPDSRGYILFSDPNPANIGHRSTTVRALLDSAKAASN